MPRVEEAEVCVCVKRDRKLMFQHLFQTCMKPEPVEEKVVGFAGLVGKEPDVVRGLLIDTGCSRSGLVFTLLRCCSKAVEFMEPRTQGKRNESNRS